jgi:hypothetical protein
MTALPLLGWLVAAALVLVVAWQAVDLVAARRTAQRQQVALEEAEAWGEEWRHIAEVRAAAMAAAETRYRHTEALYAYHVHGTMLALNARQLLPWMVRNGQRKPG